MKLRTFVRYDGKNKIVRGSAILAKKAPDVGNWEEILFETDYSSSSREHGMLAYIAYDRNNNFLPASNILVRNKPKTGRWKQINVLRNFDNVNIEALLTEDALHYLLTENGSMIVLEPEDV